MPRPMKVTNEPALGLDLEYSDSVFPVARLAASGKLDKMIMDLIS